MSLQNLLKIGQLKEHPPDAAEVQRLVAAAARNLADARVTTISPETRFYWYFILTTNCRDLNPSDLNEFPINLDDLSPQSAASFVRLCEKLMEDYKKKSQLKEKTSSITGDMVYQEFYPRLSKHIIDEIDTVLAKHYGFTAGELDFVLNYDIKYRMGRDAEGDDE